MKMYTVSFTAQAATVAVDFFEITAASTRIVIVHAIQLMQTTEVADAAEEGLALLLKRNTSGSTSGSGGASPTPAPVEANQGASGFTADTMNTTKMTGGTAVTIAAWAWNIRGPFEQIFTPEMRPVISPSERLTVELTTTPADSITFSGTLWAEEIG
jgi:hypothetical protein